MKNDKFFLRLWVKEKQLKLEKNGSVYQRERKRMGQPQREREREKGDLLRDILVKATLSKSNALVI